MTLIVLAAARPPQVLAAATAAKSAFIAASVALLVPSRHLRSYASCGIPVIPLDMARFPSAPPAELAGLNRRDAVIGILNNASGHGSDDLMRLLFFLPCRTYLFTFDGRLLPLTFGLRLRWMISRFWAR